MRVPPGVTVFDSASWNGIAIDSTCGGHGTCHKCKVRLTPATPATRHDVKTFSREQLDDGWRLACLARATRDLEVVVPPLTTRPKAATVGVGRQVILRPAVQKRYVELAEPTLEDQATDLDRLLAAIDDLEPRADLLRAPAAVPGAAGGELQGHRGRRRRGPDRRRARRHHARCGYAIAFDLGTTTVVATLLDLVTGTPVAVASMLNKQQPFGGDVISRISATMMDPNAAERLRVAACETLAELAAQVCREGGVDPAHVYEVAIAGNATMTALALGIDPEPLGVAPFIMSTATPPTVLAADLGLALHPRARVMLFPALGAYVGGDIVAGMLASGMDRDKRTRLFIDVGTNCEIVLSNGDRILSTAAPAGPAFEGGAIRCGMRADDGAIEVVTLVPDGARMPASRSASSATWNPRDCAARGSSTRWPSWSGSGCSTRAGGSSSEEVAKELAPGLSDRLTMLDSDKRGQERVFVLHRPAVDSDPADCVVLTQRDVRELQFAKAAISTGWTLLLEELGLEHRDVQQVLLAGSFGSYLSAASAIRIGLVPKLPVLRIVAAGNVAGEGAKMALLSIRERAGALALLEEVTYVELSDRPEFNDKFVEQLAFCRTDIALIACGALAQPAAEIVERRGWSVAVHPLPPLLHNQPHLIADEVRGLATALSLRHQTVAVAYADCGTYGALDAVCSELGLRRLPGLHCYDLFAGESRLAAFLDDQPGTYLLTDFLVRSFDRTVVRELGLDRHPELRDDYFRHYTRVVWLAQEPDETLRALAEEAARKIGLPLTVVETGDGRLEEALEELLTPTAGSYRQPGLRHNRGNPTVRTSAVRPLP